MWFLWLLLVIFVLAIDYIIAKEFYEIACQKGHDERKYFWYSFLFSFIGYLMVVALPDHPQAWGEELKRHSQKKPIRRRTTVSHKWCCSYCNQMTTTHPCEHCGK